MPDPEPEPVPDPSPPVVNSLTVSSARVNQNQTTTFTAQVADPDNDIEGGVLEYNGIVVGEFGGGAAGRYQVAVSWAQMNQLEIFDFEAAGQSIRFTARFVDQTGLQGTRDANVTFICQAGGVNVPACNGTCAPSADIGCLCEEGEPAVCDGNQVVICGAAPQLGIDCGNIIGDGSVVGRCFENPAFEDGVTCGFPIGEACGFSSGGQNIFFPCYNAAGTVANRLGCLDGICASFANQCDPNRDYQAQGFVCDGQRLVYACIDHGPAVQAVAYNCQAAELGGARGSCSAGACRQPDAGAPCIPGLIECAAGRRCLNVVDGQGTCG
ncbi:MAG: hypothetical protein R3F65_07605 [bacterium]